MDREIRERKKAVGVPKVKETDSYIDDIRNHLLNNGFLRESIDNKIANMVKSGYYESSMSQQANILTKCLISMCSTKTELLNMIRILKKSDISRIRCRVPMMIYETFSKDIRVIIDELKESLNDNDTGPRENSQAILRQLIIDHGESALNIILNLSNSSSYKERRACVEATRAVGVWVQNLYIIREKPELIYDMLNNLINDDSEYVRKAVANSINDLSKFNPELIKQWSRNWLNMYGINVYTVLYNGLRYLRKKMDIETFKLLGFSFPTFPNKLEVATNIIDIGNIYKNEVIKLKLSIKYIIQESKSIYLQVAMINPVNRIKIINIGKIILSPSDNEIQIEKKYHFSDTSNYKNKLGVHLLKWYISGNFMLEQKFEYLGSYPK